MEAQKIIGDLLFVLIGMLLLIFNKQIGSFAKEYLDVPVGLKVLTLNLWFPRANTILVGFFLTIIGLWGFYDEIVVSIK